MFTVPALQYEYDALGRSISADIMRLHHDKHHQAYVDKLNAAIDKAPSLEGKSIVELLRDVTTLPVEVRQAIINQGGGHYNHSRFWQWMSPNGGGEPTGELQEAIIRQFGSFQAFVDAFTSEAMGVFGSGWVWLQPDMTIRTTANQDSPLSVGADEPLLGLDVWEHAYYLDYKNKRDDYIHSWWDVVDWDTIAEQYTASR